MTPPSILVEIPLEGSPSVRFFAMREGDEQRLFAWLAGRPDLEQLIADLAGYRGGRIEAPPGAVARWAA